MSLSLTPHDCPAGLLRDYVSDGREGLEIADEAFVDIIAALRQDPRFRAVSLFDLELLLADKRAELGRRLVRELRSRIHIDDLPTGALVK